MLRDIHNIADVKQARARRLLRQSVKARIGNELWREHYAELPDVLTLVGAEHEKIYFAEAVIEMYIKLTHEDDNDRAN